MRKTLATGLAGSASVMVVFLSSGLAGAVDEYKGQTYEKAASSIKGYGGTPVIAGRVGEFLPTDQCVVSGSRMARSLDASGRNSGSKVLLYLNCNDHVAGAHSGNSVASPEGKEGWQHRQLAVRLSEDYEKATAAGTTPGCFSNEGAPDYCRNICKETGLCSADLMKALGL